MSIKTEKQALKTLKDFNITVSFGVITIPWCGLERGSDVHRAVMYLIDEWDYTTTPGERNQ